MELQWLLLAIVVIADASTTIIAIRSGAGAEDNFLSAKIMGVFGLIGWAILKAAVSVWSSISLDGQGFTVGGFTVMWPWVVILVMFLIALNNARIIRKHRERNAK